MLPLYRVPMRVLFALLLAAITYAEASSRTAGPPLLTLALPPSALLPNPQLLPARTFATLTAANVSVATPFTRASTFEFRDVPADRSYLCEVWSRDYVFAPSGDGGHAARVEVWQTFRGNEWDNKGEKLGEGADGVRVDVSVIAERRFYEERKGCKHAVLLTQKHVTS